MVGIPNMHVDHTNSLGAEAVRLRVRDSRFLEASSAIIKKAVARRGRID
jgi:hypothetical protein